MRSDSRRSSSQTRRPAAPEPFQTEFARQVEKWQRLRRRSARKPSPGAVHDLRVATLRLQAGIEYWAGRRRDHPLSGQAARWIAQAGKLRDALGAVRDADVTLEKLKDLEKEIRSSNGSAPADGPQCLRQAGKLQREVKRARRAGARDLVDWLEERGARMERLTLRLGKALDELNPFPAVCGAILLSKFLSGQAISASKLDRKTLHAFRKQLKRVRYLTEISAGGRRSEEALSVPLRELQKALGEWHDWDALARSAGRALGARGKLARLLEDRAATAMESAIAQIRRSLTELPAQHAKPRPLR